MLIAYAQTEVAINIMKDLASNPQQFGVSGIPSITSSFVPSSRAAGDENVKSALSHIRNGLDFQAIKIFFSQAWFRRLWVLQEACLPSEVIFYNGSNVIKADDNITALSILNKLQFEFNDVTCTGGVDITLAMLLLLEREAFRSANSSEGGQGSLLYDVAYMHQDSECRNSLDKIYALLGLRTACDLLDVEVNYSKSPLEVFRDFTWKYLEMGDLGILHYAPTGSKADIHSPQIGKFPTWTIDWTVHIPPRLSVSIDRRFQAATSISPSVHVQQDILPYIGVMGVKIGSIEDDISSLTPGLSLREILKYYPQQVLNIRRHFTKSKQPYPNGETLSDAFARILVMDGRIIGATIRDPQVIPRFWAEFEHAIKHDMIVNEFGMSESEIFLGAALVFSPNRTFFVTEAGYFGLGYQGVKPGDTVVIFDGDTTPFVLRQINPDTHSPDLDVEGNFKARLSPEEQYVLIGECYVHGLMDGEVVAPE